MNTMFIMKESIVVWISGLQQFVFEKYYFEITQTDEKINDEQFRKKGTKKHDDKK